ncbi:structural maintenance of chromosomes flexible hinge domain-containing protein GMI1 [Abrus precatorius]|uniref:Structural maintenance of chromosomes flexible hinge domain-containing protein GMI1 n=1 Tax=Abrus precatorius TaxID=3816 RepID=A0A8B8JKT8_ABRPR|nr:structural maintenance of chromosomes flexible hinge domain-containing protein GMI1 [Abrus precatorius]
MEGALASKNSRKRKMVQSDDEDDGVGKVCRFKILLPNGMSVELTLRDPEPEMLFGDFMNLVKEKYLEARKHHESMKKRRDINWKGGALFLRDANDAKIRNVIKLKNFKPNKCHTLRFHDGSSDIAESFENMWDLTPDTDLLLELPEEYTFETALADLIDNSLQAVWSNGENNRKLIRVNLGKDKLSIFDNGPGMDDTDENSLVKWGKMGASLHRSSRSQAIGGKPPYLMPYFGMFGYGGPISSMHLGRRALVCSKTKHVKKVYMLLLEREALLSSSSSKLTWKTSGGIRDPSKEEIRDSHGSFTKVEIYKAKVKDIDINRLQCYLKDIYFPYIQSDDMFDRGKTITPIEFKVNDVDLTEVQGGEVAITNLHSCNGPEFVLQLHLSLVAGSKELQEANACLKFVYLPFIKGKENIERVLEKLTADGCVIRENFQSLSRVSVRRLGRLLPDARWTFLPFMDSRNKKGIKAQILKRCSRRVKCFIETDGGFKPTLSKTDLAHHNPFTTCLKNLGNKISDNEKDVTFEIWKGTKELTLLQLEREYQEWILHMHRQYDEEFDAGEDKPVIIVGPANAKELGISSDVIRVHQVFKREEKSWKHGQKIKVLKGACAGCHQTTIYATIEYFLLEGFEGDTGGEARIICRPINIPDENGCFLSVKDEDACLEIRGSLSLPLSVIDSGKLVPVENIEWEKQLKKEQLKSPLVDVLGPPNQHLEAKGLDSNCKSFEKKAIVERSHLVGKCRLLTSVQNPQLDVRVGSTLPTLDIAYYDIYNRQAPFHSIPDVTVKLQTAVALHVEVCGLKICLSTDKLTLKIMNVMIISNELDKIKPSYCATLFIASNNVPLSLSIPCRVYPAFLNRVVLKPKIIEDQLLPGFIFKELMLEMFDRYGNRVIKGSEVTLAVAGFNVLDDIGMIRKVDDKGRIDLGGLLKLTADFGENASMSVMLENQTIFRQEFSTARRNLRIASGVPDFCAAGGHLENINFEIVNPDGDVDIMFHHNDKDGQYHMLTIKSDLFSAQESIRYTFKHGRCTIPSIPIPISDGSFCFEAAHSQYTGLSLIVKVPVIKMPIVEYVGQPPSPDKSIMHLEELPSFYHENNWMISFANNDDKEFDSICRLGEKIKNVESHLNELNEQKSETEQEIVKLLEKIQPYQLDLVNMDSSFTKDELMTKVLSMENSAISVLCNLSRHKNQQNYFLEDIIGVVALIGTVQSPELSRIFAEYLGEDKMSGVIYRSFDAASSLERYKQNGEIDCERALHAEAAALGKDISKRFLVICIEDIRPYTGRLQENDFQRKLALPNPTLPNGRTPDGFVGYAVNMVDLEINYLQTKTTSGHGLRETVLFSLFKKLHVYKTRENMVAARACIEDGAVSLDGGILRESGILSLGYGNPFIYFPCENQMVHPRETEEILTRIKDKKSDLRIIEQRIKELTSCREKCIKKFKIKEERYNKFMDRMEPMTELLKYIEAGDEKNRIKELSD